MADISTIQKIEVGKQMIVFDLSTLLFITYNEQQITFQFDTPNGTGQAVMLRPDDWPEQYTFEKVYLDIYTKWKKFKEDRDNTQAGILTMMGNY